MSTGTELVQVSTQTAIQQGGLGVDFSSDFFKLKPLTLSINQPNTQAEGAIAGKLRIVETGNQLNEMDVVLLKQPVKQRSWYTGEPGQLNRSKENLMCFSRDAIAPDKSAKMPQALLCSKCAKSDWSKYRQERVRENIPPCEEYFYVLLIDTVLKMPMQMYIRGKSKEAFGQGMENVARTILMAQVQGLKPNIFDVRFKLSSKKIKTGAAISYVPLITDTKMVSPGEREEFGAIFDRYVAAQTRTPSLEEQAAEQIEQANASVDSAVIEGEYVNAGASNVSEDGTITI